MDVDRWQRLSEVFHAALALERDQRAAFLEDACGEDDALRRDVEALLAKNVRGSGFTKQPALAAAQLTSDADTTPLSRTLAGRRFGRYMIVDWVGAGGMGEVYSAYDDQLDRHIAIKVLPRSSFKDPAARARLIREARTASKLNHANICTIYEVGEVNGQTYIAMELIEGEPLSARLKRQPLTSAEIVSCSLQMAEALTHAHERSVIHRDLKSANVIITRDGRVKILDFGLAKHMAAADLADMTTRIQATVTQPGVVLGTLAYMAPELLRGQPADARSDIWALGVVYYEMAAGYLPFAAMTPVDLMTAVLNSATPPLPENVPPPIADVVDKCLEKAPERRFQSAREVLSTLESSSVSSRRVYKGAPMLGARAITALLAIGFVLVIAVAAILDVGQIRERADRMFSNNVLAFAERDWLLLADFENQTTDSIFDKSLDTALSVGIGQSSYVNVVPASRIESALRRMKLSEATAVDSTTAREIAQREGVKLILAPSIAEVGGSVPVVGLASGFGHWRCSEVKSRSCATQGRCFERARRHDPRDSRRPWGGRLCSFSASQAVGRGDNVISGGPQSIFGRA